MSMLEHIVLNPSVLTEMAFYLGQLHANMHSHSCRLLPLQIEYLSNKITRADIHKSVRINRSGDGNTRESTWGRCLDETSTGT